MLDIGWSELILISVVALIVIGPKDLPDMFRQLGRFTGKMRSMARDFSRAMEQAANESGVKDVAKDLKSATSAQGLGLGAVKDAMTKFERWDPLQNAAPPSKAPAIPATVAPEPSAVAAAAVHVGPETQTLLDKQAARAAIVRESTDRLRALNAGAVKADSVANATAISAPVIEKTAPAKSVKPKLVKSAVEPVTAPPLAANPPKPRRKLKKADEA